MPQARQEHVQAPERLSTGGPRNVGSAGSECCAAFRVNRRSSAGQRGNWWKSCTFGGSVIYNHSTMKALTDEQQLLAYCAKHAEAVSGKRYHRAATRTARWFAEQTIPAMLRCFDAGTITRLILDHVRGRLAGAKLDEHDALAAWHIRTLFTIAESPESPATARLHALHQIRGLVAECLRHLHPEAFADGNAAGDGERRSPFSIAAFIEERMKQPASTPSPASLKSGSPG